MMRKLDPKSDGASENIIASNIDQLRELFPEVFTESSDEGEPRWKIDFDALRQLLGGNIEEKQERYSFTWNGKSRARRIAQTPSTGTLRPCPGESVNWDSTRNLFIEGDNLEVLKLLQKSYHKKVKMIYIDPPYNTGNDFIYPDDFRDNIANYKSLTGQTDEDGRSLTTNAETSGRYHTNWLNMMYPRLKLARNLLRDDGVIFISIDDGEVANIRKLCDEIFGEENFIANVVWQKKQSPQNDATYLSDMHDHIVIYAKMAKDNKTDPNGWNRILIPREEAHDSRYNNPDNDPRGDWTSVDCTCNKTSVERPNLYYSITNPLTGKEVFPSTQRVWRYERDTMKSLLSEDRIWWGENKDNFPRQKRFLSEVQAGIVPSTWWSRDFASDNQAARRELRAIFGEDEGDFNTPKPTGLVKRMLQISSRNGIILDFFAGSCTTAHAVLDLNMTDGGNRKFIMVQLPEPCDENSEAYKAGFKKIADIGKERIRRVIRKISDESSEKSRKDGEKLPGMKDEQPEQDLGFKVFKLDSSNIIPWDADFDNLEDALFNAVESVKPDRSQEDILYELLLKYGLDLAVPIEERSIAGKSVYIIGGGALVVCLDGDIGIDLVQGIAALKKELNPEMMRVIFRDSGFADDVVKTNAVQILRQARIEDVRSL